jgi:thioredoxin reductase
MLTNDFVFAMVGYSPDVEFMAAHGILIDPQTAGTMTRTPESERKGIYLAGVAGRHAHQRNSSRTAASTGRR